jgi:hypothetical protein
VDDALTDLIRSSRWMMRVLEAVRDEPVPDAWTGGGVLRDLVWGERYGPGFSPEQVRDVDVAFFDSQDLSRAYDDRVTGHLRRRLPNLPWEARNQAAVHTWYSGKIRRWCSRTTDIDPRRCGHLARDCYRSGRAPTHRRRHRDLRPVRNRRPPQRRLAPESSTRQSGTVPCPTRASPAADAMAECHRRTSGMTYTRLYAVAVRAHVRTRRRSSPRRSAVRWSTGSPNRSAPGTAVSYVATGQPATNLIRAALVVGLALLSWSLPAALTRPPPGTVN